MIENINDLIETEIWNLEEAKRCLVKLDESWFKFGKKEFIEFLKVYIELKEEFINTLQEKHL